MPAFLLLIAACAPPVDTADTDTDVDTDTNVDTDVTDTGLGPDTCTVGDNFGTITVTPLNSLDLLFGWEPGTGMGADLPDAYFEAFTVDAGSDAFLASAVDSIHYISPHKLRIALSSPVDGPGTLILDFPDRRNFVTCEHPGMDDVYQLRISATLVSGAWTDPVFTQTFVLGDI